MHLNHNNQRAYNNPIEELFLQFYAINDLLPIYNEALLGSQGKAVPKKRTIKAKIIGDFLALNEDPKKKAIFVDYLPKQVQTAIQQLLWVDDMPLVELEERLGYTVTEINNNVQSHQPRLQPKQYFEWLTLRYEHSWGSSEEKIDYRISLPPALRTFLGPAFPKPQGYHLTAIETLINQPPHIRYYDCSKDAIHDLTQIADYLSRGTLKTTKNGKLAKSAIRGATKLTKGGEFFEGEKSTTKLTELRHESLIEYMMGYDLSYVKKMGAGEHAPAKVVRDTLSNLQKDPDALNNRALAHLKQRYAYEDEELDTAKLKKLFSIFKKLPPKDWITQKNLHQYQAYRDIDCCIINPNNFRYRATERHPDRYAYNYDKDLTRQNIPELITQPLISAAAFILAAFGLLEIAYTLPPRHLHWHLNKNDHLTPYDGLFAVRLTLLGRFAFGHTTELNIKVEAPTRCEITFHPSRLHLNCKNLDPITDLALKEFMEPITPTFYRMTRTSFLKGCNQIKEIKRRIADFKQRIPGELPQNWQHFFDELQKIGPALKSERAYIVYQIAEDPALRKAFLTDPTLRKKTIRAEGTRVLIAQPDLSAVKTRLRALGFIADA